MQKVQCWRQTIAGDAGDEETAEGADGALDEPADGGGEDEAHEDGEEMDVAVLKADEGIAVEIRDVIEGGLGVDLEHEPADVGVEEALADVVGVFLVIDVLVMAAMLGAPHEGGVLEGAGAEEEGEEPDGPMRLEGEMGEMTVVAQGDAEAAEGRTSRRTRPPGTN